MARATKILNKYEIKMLALSDRDINYDNFYKEELIAFCKCLKEEYKKQKKALDKIIEIINYYGADKEHNDNAILRRILKDMLDILKEVSE